GGGASTPTTLPARPPISRSARRPSSRGDVSRRPRRATHSTAAATPTITSQAPTTPTTPGARRTPSAANAPASPAPARTSALAPERLVHPVVVIPVEKAALLEVAAQDLYLFIREADVAVPCHIEVRDVPQIGAGQRHHPLALAHR